jgi:putative transposase
MGLTRDTGVATPNTNIIIERFFGSLRREALDNFILTGRSQIERILEEYVALYNCQRPHQGIQHQIPKPGESEKMRGVFCRSAVLDGLHHHYYRRAA